MARRTSIKQSPYEDLVPKDTDKVQEDTVADNRTQAETVEPQTPAKVASSPGVSSSRTTRSAKQKPAAEVNPKKKKEGFYMDPNELKYADLVYMSTQVQTGIRSKTAFYEEAIRFFVKHLEEEHNKGKRYKNPFEK